LIVRFVSPVITSLSASWRKDSVAVVSFVVAVLALAVSAGALWYQHVDSQTQSSALRAQADSLVEARREFEASGPKFTASATLSVWDGKAAKWVGDVARGANATLDETSPPRSVWVIMTVTNTGRTAGAVSSLGIKIADAQSHSVTPWCSAPKDGVPISACEMPLHLEPAQSVRIHLAVEDIQAALKCNDYIKNHGIVVALEGTSNQVADVASGSGVQLASFCAKLPGAK